MASTSSARSSLETMAFVTSSRSRRLSRSAESCGCVASNSWKRATEVSRPAPAVSIVLPEHRPSCAKRRSCMSFGDSARRRDGCEQAVEPLGHCRVRENSVTQNRVGKAAEHRRLHGGHDLPGFGADHREAENAVARCFDEHLHRSEEHTSELQSRSDLVCRLL